MNAARAAEGAPERASLDGGQKRVLDTAGHQVGVESTVPHIPEALYLWIELDLNVFGVEHKAKFTVLPIP